MNAVAGSRTFEVEDRRHPLRDRWKRRLVILGTAMALVVAVSLAISALVLNPPEIEAAIPRDWTLSNVTIVNPGGTRLESRTVRLHGDRIESIAPSSEDLHGEGDVAPGNGRFALPGLIDLHVHLPPALAAGQRSRFLHLFLAHGITSVRDTGSIAALALGSEIAAGRLSGPRVFGCGSMLDGENPELPWARAVTTPTAGRQAVRTLAAEGARCVKVYRGISAEVLDAIHEEARAIGLPVIGHLPFWASFDETRIDELQHVCDPHCWSLDAQAIDSLVRASLEGPVAHVPTLVVYEGQESAVDFDRWRQHRESKLLPAFWAETLWNPANGLGAPFIPPNGASSYRTAHAALRTQIQRAVRRLHEAGSRILVGTDTPNVFVVPGASLHQELRLLVRAGFSPEEALQAATALAGEALRIPQLGVLEAGAPADLMIFRDDPTRDLAALNTLEAVVVAGRYFSKSDVDAVLSRQDRYFQSFPFRWLSHGAARAIAWFFR